MPSLSAALEELTPLHVSSQPCLPRSSGAANASCSLSCIAPGCKWCSNLLRGLEEPTQTQQSRCESCECRACWFCRAQAHKRRWVRGAGQQQRVAAPTAVGSLTHCGSNALVVVVRGQSLRNGTRLSMTSSTAPTSFRGQLTALASLRQRVLQPAVTAGWDPVEAVVDIDAPPIARMWVEAEVERALQPHLVGMRVQPLLSNQMRTLLANLEFALHTARVPPAQWRALLLVRIDLAWKRDVPLPSPAQVSHELVVPWRVDTNLGSNGAWLNDVLVLVPACRVSELWTALVRRVTTPREEGRSLHFFCWASACGLRFLETCSYAANTAAERNPLYSIIGRPEASFTPNCARRHFNRTVPLQPDLRLGVLERCAAAACAPSAVGLATHTEA